MLPGGAGKLLRSKRMPCSKRVTSMGSITGSEEEFWSCAVTAKTWVGMWASRETSILNVGPMASGLSGTVGRTLK